MTSAGVAETAAPAAVAPPPGHPRFPLMDALRAIAALLVLLSHAIRITETPDSSDRWASAFTTGVQGVTIFFVISGFLLYRPFVNAQMNGAPKTPWTDYLRRRLLRIVPAYWLALTLLAIYPGLAGVFSDDWWRYYLLLSGYAYDTLIQGLLVSWSLGVELTFYLALPLYAALAGRLAHGRDIRSRVRLELALLAAIALASIALRAVDYASGPDALVQDSLPAFLFWFALGMGMAVVSSAQQAGVGFGAVRRAGAHPGLVWAGALAAYALLAVITNPDGTYSDLQWTLGYYVLGGLMSALLVAPSVFGGPDRGWPGRVLGWAPLAWLGLVSYGIYLWHVPVLTWLFDRGLGSFPALVLAGALVTVLFAAASYYLVERPILRFKYRRPRESTAPAERDGLLGRTG